MIKTKTNFQKSHKLGSIFSIFLAFVVVIGISFLLRNIEETFTAPTEAATVISSESVSDILSQGYLGGYGRQSLGQDSSKDTSFLIQGEKSISDLISQGYLDKSISLESSSLQPRVLAASTVKSTPDFKTQKITQSFNQLNIEAGRGITFEIEFQNTGRVPWYNHGPHFMALNVTSPTGRVSSFQHIYWRKYYRPAILSESQVEPGQSGHFRFALQAPSTPGDYVEKFGLVAENLTWIEDGDFEIPIKVLPPPSDFQAQKISQSFDSLNIDPDKRITFEIQFQNTGRVPWYNHCPHFMALNVTSPTGRVSSFQDETWKEYYYRPTRLLNSEVKPGEVGRFRFVLQVPSTPGDYVEKFGLVAENLTWIEGGDFEIPIHVNQPQLLPPNTNPEQSEIRVGLYNPKGTIKITANRKYEIRDSQDNLLAAPSAKEISTVVFQNNKYKLTTEKVKLTTSSYIRFVPKDDKTIFEILNYENYSQWQPDFNDNKFRGKIEIRYAKKTQKPWVINELPMEMYLRGVAEAANDDHPEYLKALIIAARTYAQYHFNTGTKHQDENFMVDATFDQVYRGHGFELRAPNITKIVEKTEGLMVTYDREVVVTPYFSHTDGRTRAWEEVWAGGPYPWLVSVPDLACKGKKLLGHGVGMSAYGARVMASEGKTYKEILKYYYTGVKIEKIY